MALNGKLSTEIVIHAPAGKFFNLVTKFLHDVQNICERVHHTKLHQDGKVTTCKETIESIDENNKTVKFNLFDGDISQQYKVLKVTAQEIDNSNGSVSAKWTLEYEKINDNVEAPYGYLELYDKNTKEMDAHLLKA
ncbi:MLP-like protein 43 isoform X2 [Arachis stenosperma]|uniref:MLP-like protein 43 isoform X2 n=1 Tax=Arachis stenosperma TaxID=217475 RepID=UPI0025AC0922|nr:MLP-like protein 43 isoform X2 [Arachis stenosperma]